MSVYDLVDARKAGKAAHKAGEPISANPWPHKMSNEDGYQLRKHEAWAGGWEEAHKLAMESSATSA